MQPDDEVCLCFHVTRRKLENWLRIQRPAKTAQLSECFGAGTGCGWCRPFLKRLFEASQHSKPNELPGAEQYAAARAAYIDAGKGRPPS